MPNAPVSNDHKAVFLSKSHVSHCQTEILYEHYCYIGLKAGNNTKYTQNSDVANKWVLKYVLFLFCFLKKAKKKVI